MPITSDQFAELISVVGYSALFFGLILGFFLNALFLLEDGLNLISFGNKNMGWLYLLLIPIDFCVGTVAAIVIVPNMF